MELPLYYEDIIKLIPHRYPFLLVDRITEIELEKRIVGYKNVTANEYFFQGHFPGNPIMPGVLIVEAMAQVGGVLARLSIDGLQEEEQAPGPPPFDELAAKLTQCRKDAGTSPLDVTLYLDEDGMPQAFGVSTPDGKAQRAVNCLSTVIQTTSFPAPGDSFAKVTVPVR